MGKVYSTTVYILDDTSLYQHERTREKSESRSVSLKYPLLTQTM
jgi:hypothetical protein